MKLKLSLAKQAASRRAKLIKIKAHFEQADKDRENGDNMKYKIHVPVPNKQTHSYLLTQTSLSYIRYKGIQKTNFHHYTEGIHFNLPRDYKMVDIRICQNSRRQLNLTNYSKWSLILVLLLLIC